MLRRPSPSGVTFLAVTFLFQLDLIEAFGPPASPKTYQLEDPDSGAALKWLIVLVVAITIATVIFLAVCVYNKRRSRRRTAVRPQRGQQRLNFNGVSPPPISTLAYAPPPYGSSPPEYPCGSGYATNSGMAWTFAKSQCGLDQSVVIPPPSYDSIT
uniref:Uncharacterized protein n=1 Tax=Plectus sambesii TaxID=2011161 RepID=A0A914XK39_9BILA